MELLTSGLISAIVLVLGAAIGSFLNVVVYRIPANLSLLFPPSRCPTCLRSLKAYDNVPVFGWLWLKGRCRFCHTAISPRYPLVEAATGLLFLWVYWTVPLPLAIGYWALLSWLLALALIDLDTLTLPNALTQSGLVAGLVFQTVLPLLTADATAADSARGLMSGVLGAVVGIWLLDGVTIVGSIAYGQTAMGGGDAKLAALIGAWLGWQNFLLAGFLACALGAVVGGGAMALGWLDRRQPMPFGPFLAIGAMLAACYGNPLIELYLRVFFPTL